MSQYRSSVPSRSTSPGLFATLVGVGLLSLTVWALVCAGQLVAIALEILFSGQSISSIPGLAANMVEGAIFGGAGGFAVGVAAVWRAEGRPRFGGLFWGASLTIGFIGLAVATCAGAVGTLALPPDLSKSAHAIFSADEAPIMVFIGGGIDDPGGAGIFGLAFLFIVVFLLVVVLAAQIGIAVHVVYWVLALQSGGAAAPYFAALITTRTPAIGRPAEKLQPITVGLQRGLFAGVLVGLCEAAFTIWGVAALAHAS